MNKKREKMSQAKLNMFRICFLIAVVACVISSFAWYLFINKKDLVTTQKEVLKPYNLFLYNSDKATSLQLNTGNMHPGETKQMVICVSNNHNEETTLANTLGTFEYNLELIYTNNLPVDYNLFELVSTESASNDSIQIEGNKGYWSIKNQKLVGEDISTTRHKSLFDENTTVTDGIVNLGTYMKYSQTTDAQPKKFQLTLSKKENTQNEYMYEYDYYLLEIKWKVDVDFNAFKKEVDQIYLVGNAIQKDSKTNP